MKNIICKLKEPQLLIDIHKNLMYAFAEQNEYLLAFDINEVTNEYANIYKIEENRYIYSELLIEPTLKTLINTHLEKIKGNTISLIDSNHNECMNVTSFENNKNNKNVIEEAYLDFISDSFGKGEICHYSKIEFLESQMFGECNDSVIIMYPPR